MNGFSKGNKIKPLYLCDEFRPPLLAIIWGTGERRLRSMALSFATMIVGPFLLLGCSHQVTVNYYCDPSGATIYEEGVGKLGTCPVVLKYSSFDKVIQDDILYTDKIRVVWESGASLLVQPTALSISPEHMTSVMFVRPRDFPSFNLDLKASTTYEESLMTPKIQYIVSPHQDEDLLDTLNRNIGCMFAGLVRSVGAVCP